METLKNIITRMRGPQSMIEYAEACGISRASLYRIAAGNINRPVPSDTLHALLSHADPNANVTIEDLEAAVDEVLKSRSTTATAKQKTLSRMHRFEVSMRRAVADYLLNSGVTVRKVALENMKQNDFEFVITAGAAEEHYSFNLKYDAQITERVKQHLYTALNLASPGSWTYIMYCYDEMKFDTEAVSQRINELQEIAANEVPEIEGSIIVAHMKESGSVEFREILLSDKKKLVSFNGMI